MVSRITSWFQLFFEYFLRPPTFIIFKAITKILGYKEIRLSFLIRKECFFFSNQNTFDFSSYSIVSSDTLYKFFVHILKLALKMHLACNLASCIKEHNKQLKKFSVLAAK